MPLRAQLATLPCHNLPPEPGYPLGCDRRRTQGRKTLTVDGCDRHTIASGGGWREPTGQRLTARDTGRSRHSGAAASRVARALGSWDCGPRVHAVLADHDDIGVMPPSGVSAPGHVVVRWVVERTHGWLNDFGKQRRCTERRLTVADFSMFLAATNLDIQRRLRAAVHDCRWPIRSTSRRLRSPLLPLAKRVPRCASCQDDTERGALIAPTRNT